jgi:AcrR family transcriptional regulator
MAMSESDSSQRVRRSPGRPMSAEVERRLLDASLAVLAKHGMSGLTVEKIADAAGVPRTTFYRRWTTANEAVAAAVKDALGAANPEAPATGHIKQDLRVLGRNMLRLTRSKQFVRAMTFLIAEMEFNPDFRATAMEVIRNRRQHTRAVLTRAQALKQLPSSLDIELLTDMFAGAMIYQLFFAEVPPRDDYAAKLASLIAGGFGRTARRPAETRNRKAATRKTSR